MYGNCIHWLEPNSIQRAESIQKLQTVEAACSEFSPRCDAASTAVSDDVVQIIVAKKTYVSYNDCAVIYHSLNYFHHFLTAVFPLTWQWRPGF